MSDILFCDTDHEGFHTGFYEASKHYQVSALTKIKPDALGLKSWEVLKDQVDFSKYKLIWMHLNPRIMYPPWYLFPRYIKKKAPDAVLILKHEWWEKYYDEPMPYILKKYFGYADYIGVNTIMGKEVAEKNIDVPVVYHHIGEPRVNTSWPPSLPWSKRGSIFVMRHTSRDSMIRKFEIGKEVGVSMTVIDAEPFTDGGRLKALAEAINVDAECYGRLDWTDFMDKIRECRVAIELDYVGICRVAYECAKVNVPMVGTNLAEYRNILFPDLTFEPDDLDGMAQKIKEIYIKEPRKIIRDGRTMAEEYFSEEACRARLFELFEEIGYEHS